MEPLPMTLSDLERHFSCLSKTLHFRKYRAY